MRIIDQSPYQKEDGLISLRDRVRGTLDFGWDWYAEMQAQKKAINALQRILDNKFTLMRNIVLEGMDIPIPMILVCPPGIYTLYVTPMRGIYRAKEDSWLVYDPKQKFNPAKPNLLTRTLLMAQVVQAYLEKHGCSVSQVEPVLMCTDPGMNVDSIRPVVRVVLSDALDHFAYGIIQEPAVLNPENIQNIVDLIAHPRKKVEEKVAVEEPVSQPKMAPQLKPTAKPASKRIPAKSKKVKKTWAGVTVGQWIVLAIMLLLILCVVSAIILYVFISQ